MLRFYENIYVYVEGRTRLSMIIERDCPAKRMSDVALRQLFMQDEDFLLPRGLRTA